MAKLPDARSGRHFWTLISWSCLKNANIHRHEAPGGRDLRNLRRFFLHLHHVSKVPTLTGMMPLKVAILETVVVFGSSYLGNDFQASLS